VTVVTLSYGKLEMRLMDTIHKKSGLKLKLTFSLHDIIISIKCVSLMKQGQEIKKDSINLKANVQDIFCQLL
jgi:hypothetical protein